MGTDDRDHMDERRTALAEWERNLRPKPGRHRRLSILVWLGVLIAIGLCVQQWIESRGEQGFRSQRGRPAARSPLASRANVRAAPPSSTLSEESASRVQQITKCMSSDGKAAYSDGTCPKGTNPSTVVIRPDLNLADGMSSAAREASLRDNSAIAFAQAQHEQQVARNVDKTSLECSQLDAAIRQLDAAARQPQPGFEQDRLRSERQRMRDRQFVLRCQ
jgi:hypothetical protein